MRFSVERGGERAEKGGGGGYSRASIGAPLLRNHVEAGAATGVDGRSTAAGNVFARYCLPRAGRVAVRAIRCLRQLHLRLLVPRALVCLTVSAPALYAA